MFWPPRNKVSVDDNTLHVQSGVTISTDGDFSEGETLFVTPAVRFYTIEDQCNVNGRSLLIVCCNVK